MPAHELIHAIAPVRLLEREAELAALEAMLGGAQSGDGRLVVVEGSAGIGKTRLLAEARALAAAAEFDVLTARGGELEGKFAYGIVRQLFEAPLAAATPHMRAELLGGAAGLSMSLFASAPATASRDGNESSFAMLHGLYWLAANFALQKPTLLIVDDLHWADEPSLGWLAYLGRRLEGLPLLLLVGTRPPGQANAPTRLTEFVTDPQAVTIRPGGLGLESAAALARDLLAAEPDAAFAAALQKGSGGNPLYLLALLDTIRGEGIAPTAEQAAHMLLVGPIAVSRGISIRLERLPPEAAKLARIAAVLGDGAELHEAAVLAELDPAAAGRAASALVASDLLSREDPIEFLHPVVRTAIYESISLGDRFDAHRRAAELRLAEGGLPEQAAAHLMLTLPTGDGFVTTTLRDAAKRSLDQGVPLTAIAYLRRALRESCDDQAADVLWELGRAEQLVGDPAACEHLCEALALTHGPARRAPLALQYARALWIDGRFEESVEVARLALEDVGDSAPSLREELLAEFIGASAGDERFYPLAADRLSGVEADRLVGGIGSDRLLALLCDYEMRLGRDRARAVELAGRALASGRLVRERDFGFYPAAVTLLLAGEVDRAAASAESALREARRAGDVIAVIRLVILNSLIEQQRGDLRAAERDIGETFELGSSHGFERAFLAVRSASMFRSASLALDVGDIDRAGKMVESLEAERRLPRPFLVLLLDVRGKLRLAERRNEDALADFIGCGKAAASVGIQNPANVAWRSQAALVLDALGRQAEAREHAEEELELSRLWGARRAIGVSLRRLGLVKGGSEGERLLREAVDTLAASPARLEHARALVDLGAALRRSNQRSEARKLLREGVELAHRCGARPLVEWANEELAATGAHPRTILRSGLDELTASERRVAQMAAEELSNKEIAQALFVTVKTVEQHLGRVYRKLDISSRRQLGAALGGPAEAPTPA
jgi:DNA-binding CsgD family transcriptional regulator